VMVGRSCYRQAYLVKEFFAIEIRDTVFEKVCLVDFLGYKLIKQHNSLKGEFLAGDEA